MALEALQEEKTLSELSEQYGVNPNVISRWKKEVLEQLPEIFSKKRGKQVKESKQKEEELYKEIGKLKVENEFLKKKVRSTVGILGMSFRVKLIEPENKEISIRNQCSLLYLNRSNYYIYKKREEKLRKLEEEEKELKEKLLKYHKIFPIYGHRKLRECLLREDYQVGRKKVLNLMKELKIRAL